MKYIKTYENFGMPYPSSTIEESFEYWKINAKNIDILEISLHKIGMSDEDIDDFLLENPGIENFCLGKGDLYVGLDFDPGHIGSSWNWSEDENDFFHTYKYKGEVKVTEKDIEDWKLQKDAKKYNL